MARRGRLPLADTRAPDRYIVVNMGPHGKVAPCRRRIFTSYGDAAKVTLRCSRSRQAADKPCFLMQGWPGAEKLVGRCDNGKCGRPKDGDQSAINRCGLNKKARHEMIAARAKRGK